MNPHNVTPLHASPEVTRLLLASDRRPSTPDDPTRLGSLGVVPCRHCHRVGLAIRALGMVDGGTAMSTQRALSTRPASTEHRPFGATSEHWVPNQCPTGHDHTSIMPAPSLSHTACPEEALPALRSGLHAPTAVVLGGPACHSVPRWHSCACGGLKGVGHVCGWASLPSGGRRCPHHP